MHITARLEEATIQQLLSELLPATVLLDDQADRGRWIQIERARKVDFIADRGLRLETSGQIQWVAAGLPINLTLNTVQLLLQPEVEQTPEGGRLVFHPSIEELDLKNVPGFLDRGVVGIVNGKLESQGNALAWDFGKALTVNAPLPPSISPSEAFQMSVQNARVVVLADALELTLTFDMRFSRTPGK